jgi:AcrR family transcriptional regulator
MTPWGDLRELSSQRLRPGPGKEREMVAHNQRQRLFAATVVATAQQGYATTRVADVIELAGVSRSTFYDHFDNLHDCFLQTLDAILDDAEAAMANALERDAPWDERLRGYYGALVDVVVAQPAAARMCLVEAYSAGPEAVRRVDRMARRVGREALAVLDESPERAGMPPNVARAVLGGLRTVVQTRLYTGHESELPALAPTLVDWALGYRTPPTELRALPPMRALPVGERDSDAPRRRILDAVIEVAAREGYAGTTITEIAKVASISLTTFYKRFEGGKEDAFLAALDDVMLRLLEVALPAYREADDWPHGLHGAIDAMFTFMARDPATAEFAAEAVWGGGPAAIARIEEGMAAFRSLLSEGIRSRPGGSKIVSEAIGASILALGYDSVARGGAERLRELVAPATYVALAPAIGSIEACAVANEA